MAIRNDNEAYQHIAYSPIYPKFKVTNKLQRNGFKDNFYGIVPTHLIPALLTDSRVETLLKAGRTDTYVTFLATRGLLRNYGSPTRLQSVTAMRLWIFPFGVIM